MIKLKRFDRSGFADEVFLFLIIILVALGSFALGRISIRTGASNEPLQIDNTGTGEGVWADYEENQAKNKSYVASKNGTKYYPINCSSADRIKEENRIYFVDKRDAEGVGYTATTTCGSF